MARKNYLTIETNRIIASADNSARRGGLDAKCRGMVRMNQWIDWRFGGRRMPLGFVLPDHCQPVKDAMAWHAAHQWPWP